MKEKRFSTKEKVALTVLIILMVAVLGVGAYVIINNVTTANDKANNPTNTTVTGDTSLLVETTAETVADNTEAQATEKSTKATEKATTSYKSSKSSSKSSSNSSKSSSSTSSKSKTSSTTSSKTSSSKSSSKSSSTSLDTISVVKPSTNTSHASEEVCTINGTKCYVGDTITVTLNLKTPKVLENFQGYTDYDSDYLKFVSAKANVNGLVNNNESTIYYNGSDITTGFDFTAKGTLYTAKFKVLKSGKTTIENTMQVLTDMNDKAVSTDSCTISVEVYS
jgi:hypothetical protein